MRKIALCLFSIALMTSLFINVKAENVSKSDNDATEDFFVNLDEEGNPIMVYHARTEAEIVGDPLYNPNRHAMLMKIRWDEKTGAPVFSYEAQ